MNDHPTQPDDLRAVLTTGLALLDATDGTADRWKELWWSISTAIRAHIKTLREESEPENNVMLWRD